jgi:hypothetical protein
MEKIPGSNHLLRINEELFRIKKMCKPNEDSQKYGKYTKNSPPKK